MPVVGHLKPSLRCAAVTALAVVAALVGAPGAVAETLADAIADAYRLNPRLQAQRADLRALDESVIEALSPYRLAASVGGGIAINRRYQRSVSFEGFSLFEQRSLDVTLTVSQLISSGGRVAAQVSAAQADVLAGRERLREMENLILLEVADAYVSVRRDERLVAIQEQVVGSYERQVAQNRAREAAGDLANTDVAQAQAQLLIIRAALAQAQASLQQSRSRFAVVVGRNPGTLEAEPPLPSLPTSIDAAYAAAERESPAYTQAMFVERAGRDRIAAARAERHPTIALQGNVGYANPLGFQTRDLGRNAGAGLTMSVPLLSGGVIGSRVRAAVAVQQSAAFQVEDSRRTLMAGLLNAWNQATTAQAQQAIATTAVQAAERALAGVRRSFTEGLRSNFEVIDSEQRLLNAQVIAANARYAHYTAQATMLALLGRMQAVALVEGVTRYDATANLARQRRGQSGPLVPLIHAFDRAQVPPDTPRRVPDIDAFATPRSMPVTGNDVQGTLATTLPFPSTESRDAP